MQSGARPVGAGGGSERGGPDLELEVEMSDHSTADDSSRDGAKARRPAPPSCAPASIPRVWFKAFDVFKSLQGPAAGAGRCLFPLLADLVVREDSDGPASETEGMLQWAGCSSAAGRSQGMKEAIGRAARAKLR